MRRYSDLIVWQRAMELMIESYRLSARLPASEAFGLVGQMRRAALSIPANIAEGHGRLHRGDFVRHLSIARGSLMELETFLHAVVRLDLLPAAEVDLAWSLAMEVRRMLSTMMRRLRVHGPARARIVDTPSDSP